MRFKLPDCGDSRIVKRFMWFPTRIGRTVYWLETINIKQYYSSYRCWTNHTVVHDIPKKSVDQWVTAKLQLIVEAAHTAGWKESMGEIEIPNEDELTVFLLNIYEVWEREGRPKSFAEFSTCELVNRYRKHGAIMFQNDDKE